MLQPNNFALLFTVLLLAVTTYFLLGSVPLLILKHDNPIDSRFIRSFYVTYYKFAFVVALATASSYTLAGRMVFAVGAGLIALISFLLRRNFIPRMDQLGAQIHNNNLVAIPAFRKIHKSAILINLTQLLVILSSLKWF